MSTNSEPTMEFVATANQPLDGSSTRRIKSLSTYVVIALTLLGGTLFAAMQLGVFSGLFGPPKVELKEAFSADSESGELLFDHSVFDELLKNHVDDNGWVDYEAIKSRQSQLDDYLTSIGEFNIDQLGRNERLAFLINSYNAFTLKLIVEQYPIGSIKDIPGPKRWDAVRWNLGGRTVSLNQIEHELIRPNFIEPRIHFALVCAAVGCPPLRNEAYSRDQLEQQLADQTNYVHGHDTWFRQTQKSGDFGLTPLYQWYGDDFVQASGSIVDFIKLNSPVAASELTSDSGIQWLGYDWSLNDVKNKQAR